MRNLSLFLILACALAGCMVGPDYRRPLVDTPGAWRFEAGEAKDVVNTPWWKQFQDPVLDSLIESALRENNDIEIAAARVEEFLGRLRTTRAALFPQVGAGALAQRIDVTRYTNPAWPPGTPNPYSDLKPYVNASWEIDLWGQLRRATEAARADLLGTAEFRRGVVLTVVTAVAVAYTDLCDLDEQLEIAKRTVSSRENSLSLFNLRFDRGLISELELRQAESEYEAAKATVPLFEQLIAEQENALDVLLGRNPGPIPRGRSLNELVLPDVPAGMPSQLLERRPDIRQAEQNLIAANARIGVAKAAYFPTITLTGLYGLESTELSTLFMGPARTWTYALPITAPIFTAGAISGTVKTAEAIRKENLLKYRQTIQQAFSEVEDGLIDQLKTREQLVAQFRQVEALRDYALLARLRYDNGYTSYLEVLDAERSLFAGELSYAQTKGNLFRALVSLYKAMGGGWIVEAERLTAG
ncbi:MAG: efflux transporter outer membrane subunit [Syntrophorhabdales bacterium]|jgi:multidrug efflux system outer membrane protein